MQRRPCSPAARPRAPPSQNSVGWTAGAGVEYAFTRQLSAKFEYLYYDLGSMTLTNANINPIILQGVLGLPLFVANATAVSTRFDGHLVRAGLNYRFDWSQPEPSASGATPLLASPGLAPRPDPPWATGGSPLTLQLGARDQRKRDGAGRDRRSRPLLHRLPHENERLSAQLRRAW